MKKLLYILIFFVLGPITFYLDGSLVADYSIKSKPLIPALIPIENASCRSKAFLVHTCEIDFELNGEKMSLSPNALAFSLPETVILLKDPETQIITSNFNIDYFWNRILLVLSGPALGLFFIYLLVRRPRQANLEISLGDTLQSDAPTPPPSEVKQTASSPTPKRKSFGRRG